MELANFLEILNKLWDFANNYTSYFNNPALFLETIKSMDKSFLFEQQDNYKLYSLYDKDNMLAPVNFVRYIILNKILSDKEITIEMIEELKENILQKNKGFFKEYPNHLLALENLVVEKIEAGRNKKVKVFRSYKNNFRILYQIHYNKYKEKFISDLESIATFLRNDVLNLKERLKFKIVSFSGSSYLGLHYCWIVLFPSNISSHMNSYQMFFRIKPGEKGFPPKSIHYGLRKGSNVIDEENFGKLQFQEIDNFNYDNFKQDLQNISTKLWEKNQKVKLKKRMIGTPNKVSDLVEEDEDIEIKVEETEDIVPLNQILYGPPGTGKTYNSINLAVKIVDPDFLGESREDLLRRYGELTDINQIGFITFHQSYSYEDFIEGLRYDEEKGIPIPTAGVFLLFIQNAKKNPEKKYVLIIDEINRGKMSKIFGELITCIEEDKRLGGENQVPITLPYSKEKISVPNNVYIIGTMNSTDRSIALLDIALRRRFQFVKLYPDHELLKKELINKELDSGFVNNFIFIFKILNERIEVLLDKDHTIGHSFFLKMKNPRDLYKIWYNQIIPLLEEYFYNDWEKLQLLLGKYKKEEQKLGKGFIKTKDIDKKSLFEEFFEDFDLYEVEDYEGMEDDFIEILENTFIKKK
ncbi:MAG: hypothetical protein CEE42_04800 [Promethearchaeota archaeon Loki_b31]|nr:MAG: hypothetical protein CEE42_04800 [Candidatus Lokiarchaeota archaeon Loki_b31]